MMEDLIRAGADVNKASEFDGLTALMSASRNHNAEGIKALLKNGAAINARDSEGKTALAVAQERKNKYFTRITETSPEIEAESKALDKLIALLKKNGGKE